MKKKNILNNLDSIVAGSVFIFMLLFTVASVFMRYIVGRPFIVTEEIQLWCMVWLVFFGIVVVSRQGSHIAIDIIVDSLPEKIRRIVETIIYLLTLAIMGYVLYQGIMYVQHMIVHDRKTIMLGVSYGIIYGAVPVSFTFSFIYTVRDLIKLWKKADVEEEVEQNE